MNDDAKKPKPDDSYFQATRWTMVLAAADANQATRAHHALSELCQAYWYPLYGYVRHKGYAVHEAEDLTQAFFAKLLKENMLAAAKPDRGRFRAFLLGTLKNFLINEWHRRTAQKRGGYERAIELDGLEADQRYRLEPSTPASPEKWFDRSWALAVVSQALAKLEKEYTSTGRGQIFEALKVVIGTNDEVSYAKLAEEMGITPEALRVAIHRIRKRYRQFLRDEIIQTVASPEEIDDEIRYLLTCLAAPEK